MTKIVNLPEATTITSDDYVIISDDPGGTPITKKISKANFDISVRATFDTRAAAVANTIPSDINALRIMGYTTVGDGGESVYKRIAGPASNAWNFQSADGAYWELVPTDDTVNIKQLGAIGDGANNDTTALQNSLDFGANRVFVPDGTYLLSSLVTISSAVTLYGTGTIKEDVLKDETILVTANNVGIDGLTFEGPEDLSTWNSANSAYRQSQKAFIKFDTCNNGFVRNTRSSAKRGLVILDTCTRMQVENNIHNGFFGTTLGVTDANYYSVINVQGGSENIITDNSANSVGSVILNGLDSDRNIFKGTVGRYINDNGIYISSGTKCSCLGGTFDTAQTGVKARGSSHVVSGFTISNTVIGISLTGNGVTPDSFNSNGFGTLCINNTILNANSIAITMGSQDSLFARDFTISENTIENHTGTNTNAAILVVAERGTKVLNNIIRGSTASYAMGIFGANSSNRAYQYDIRGNTVSDITEAMRIQNVDRSTFCDNIVRDCGTNGLEFRNCNDNFISGNMLDDSFIDVSQVGGEESNNNIVFNNIANNYSTMFMGDAVPTIGTWKNGDVVFNDSPVSGDPSKWICTVGGTPGTWVPAGYVDTPPTFETRTAAIAATIHSSVDVIKLLGYSTVGDGGEATYKRVGGTPANAWNFQSADGAYWELVPPTEGLDVRALGVVANGSYDDAAAIQDALDCISTVSGGGVVKLAPGTSRIDITLTIPDHVSIVGHGPTVSILDGSQTAYANLTSGEHIVTTGGTLTAIPDFNANVAKGDIDVELASAPSLSVGDVIVIYNPANSSWSSSRDYYRAGEFNRVAEVSGNTVTLDQPLFDSYDTADVDLYRLDSSTTCKLSDFSLIGLADTGNTVSGIVLYNAVDSVVERVTITNCSYASLSVENSYNVDVNDCRIEEDKISSLGLDYGIVIGNSHDVRVNGGYFHAGRHAVSIGGGGNVGDVPNRLIEIVGATIQNSNNNICAADIHGNAEWVSYRDCKIFGGIDFGGDNVTIERNYIRNVSGGGTGKGVAALYGGEFRGGNHSIIDNIIESDYDGGLTRGSMIDIGGNAVSGYDNTMFKGGTLIISGNRMEYYGFAESVACVYVRQRGYVGSEKIYAIVKNNTYNDEHGYKEVWGGSARYGISFAHVEGNYFESVIFENNHIDGGGIYIRKANNAYMKNNIVKRGYTAEMTHMTTYLECTDNYFEDMLSGVVLFGLSTGDMIDHSVIMNNVMKNCGWFIHPTTIGYRTSIQGYYANTIFSENNKIIDHTSERLTLTTSVAHNFTPGETVTGNTSNATATVYFASTTANPWIPIKDSANGTFVAGEEITGSISAQTAILDDPPVSDSRNYSFSFRYANNLYNSGNFDLNRHQTPITSKFYRSNIDQEISYDVANTGNVVFSNGITVTGTSTFTSNTYFGVNDSVPGVLNVYGGGAGEIGGIIYLFNAVDHDTNEEYWNIRAQDGTGDFAIGSQSTTVLTIDETTHLTAVANGFSVNAGDLKVAGGANIDGGTLWVGISDSVPGQIRVLGGGAGEVGGAMLLYNAIDHDTNVQYWNLSAQDATGNFRIASDVFAVLEISESTHLTTVANGITVTAGDTTIDAVLNISVANTVANLPTPTTGKVARVNDANTPAVGSTVVGGGAAQALVWYNGSNWTVIGV
jgi:hypothetical protein